MRRPGTVKEENGGREGSADSHQPLTEDEEEDLDSRVVSLRD